MSNLRTSRRMKFILLLKRPIFYLSRLIRKLDNRVTLFFLKRFKQQFRKTDENTGKSRLFFVLENIGDTICATPVLNLISQDDWVVCTKYNRSIVDMLGLKNVLVLNRDPGIMDFLKTIYRLGKISFSDAVVLDYTRAGDFGVLTAKFLKTGRIYSGFDTRVSGDVHASKLMTDNEELDIFSVAKATIAEEVFFKKNKELKKEIKINCGNEFEIYGDFFGIHIGGFGSVSYPVSRQYPEDYTFKLVRMLLNKGFKIVLTGDESDRKRFRKFSIMLENENGFMDFSGKLGIRQLACLLKELKCYITPDNGTLHLAQAVGCRKIFALLGPTDPDVVRGKNTEIIRLGLSCSPCHKFLNFPERCINPDNNACLNNMNPEIIINRLISYLEKT